jgi:hypothetical protein
MVEQKQAPGKIVRGKVVVGGDVYDLHNQVAGDVGLARLERAKEKARKLKERGLRLVEGTPKRPHKKGTYRTWREHYAGGDKTAVFD